MNKYRIDYDIKGIDLQPFKDLQLKEALKLIRNSAINTEQLPMKWSITITREKQVKEAIDYSLRAKKSWETRRKNAQDAELQAKKDAFPQ